MISRKWIASLLILFAADSFAQAQEFFPDFALVIRVPTYEAFLTNRSNLPIRVDGYAILSVSGSLNPATWSPMDTAGPEILTALGPGSDEFFIANPSASSLAELNPLSSATWQPGQSWSIGFPFDTNDPDFVLDAVFQFASPDGLVLTGGTEVPPSEFARAALFVVPEPSTLLLLCVGSLALLWRRRSLVCAAILAISLFGLQSPSARADSAVAWGNNSLGQVGIGTTTNHETLMTVIGMDGGVTAIAAGARHSLALKGGAVYGWGDNFFGQLGDGTRTDRPTPVAVSGMDSGVTIIATGGVGNGIGHSFALQNGALYAWGNNSQGQLGNGTAGSATSSNTPVPVSGMDSGVTAVSAGDQYSLAIRNGGLYSWGSNATGELGNGTLPTCCPVVNGRFPTPAAVIGMDSGVTAISAGSRHSLAVKDGGVYAWGDNTFGQLGQSGDDNPTPVLVAGLESGATAVAAGEVFSMAVVNGGVYYWGRFMGLTPVQVDPTNLSNIVAVADSGCCSAYALSSDGRLWSWDIQTSQPTPQQVLPPTGYKFTSIDAGAGHAVATLAAIPEPSTLLLVSLGSLAALRRRNLSGRHDNRLEALPNPLDNLWSDFAELSYDDRLGQSIDLVNSHNARAVEGSRHEVGRRDAEAIGHGSRVRGHGHAAASFETTSR